MGNVFNLNLRKNSSLEKRSELTILCLFLRDNTDPLCSLKAPNYFTLGKFKGA